MKLTNLLDGIKIKLLQIRFGGYDMESEIDKGADHGAKKLFSEDHHKTGGKQNARKTQSGT